MLITSFRTSSLYDHVHQVTGHPGQHVMQWHQKHSINADYTKLDSEQPRPVCTACIYGAMHQTPTDHRKSHRTKITTPGHQFALDAFSTNIESFRGHKHCDLLTDLATGQIYPVFTKDRSADELVDKMTIMFNMHPAWQLIDPDVIRFIRLDPESNCNSQRFIDTPFEYNDGIEKTLLR